MFNKNLHSISITVKDLTVLYSSGTHAVKDLCLDVIRGEFLTILGPSGSGKSSVLLAIAGLLDPPMAMVSGTVLFDEKEVTNVPAHQRNIPLVFQNYALFPHLTVLENVAFPLKVRKISEREIRDRVKLALEVVGLQDLSSRYPAQLSGGQKQRVALARALVVNPGALLLDEPLGALDRKLRDQMQVEIKHLQKQLGVTVVYVTHDQTEALTLSDRVAVLNDGKLVQIGNPKDVYENPSSSFVADFVGESNLFEGIVDEIQENTVICSTLLGLRIAAPSAQSIRPSSKVRILVRPENISFVSDKDKGLENVVVGSISEVFYLGDRIKYQIETESKESLVMISSDKRNGIILPRGQQVKIGWLATDTRLIET